MMPPTALQNSNDTFEEDQELLGMEDQMWSIARTKQNLERSYSVKMEVEELEDLLGPDDVDVDFRRILKEARDERGCEIFETVSTDGLSEFLVASRSRWDKYKRKWNAPWRQSSSASASEGWWQEGQRVGWNLIEKSVLEAVEDYLENCAHVEVDIEVLENLLKP